MFLLRLRGSLLRFLPLEFLQIFPHVSSYQAKANFLRYSHQPALILIDLPLSHNHLRSIMRRISPKAFAFFDDKEPAFFAPISSIISSCSRRRAPGLALHTYSSKHFPTLETGAIPYQSLPLTLSSEILSWTISLFFFFTSFCCRCWHV